MRRRSALLAAAVSCALLVPAAGAQAGEIRFVFGDTLQFLPGGGEVNTVTLERVGASYRVTDTTTPLTAGLGCTAVNANRATCPAADVDRFDFRFGDLNDTGTVAASVTGGTNFSLSLNGEEGNDTLNAGAAFEFGSYSGGDGNDRLNGNENRDRLNGGDANDTLLGGDGGDSLDGGNGNDVVRGEEGDGDNVDPGFRADGADVLSGGPGLFDDLSYRSRDIGINVSMNGQADDGEACPGAGCEGDNVAADFERVDGTEANDVLTLAAGPQLVFAGTGDDVVGGLGGADQLFGSEGADRLFGGVGDDVVSGGAGSDLSSGGSGDDSLRADTFSDREPDAFSGGGGLDLVDYGGTGESVRIDMDNQADDGREGEGDNVRRNVEDVIGGDSSDLLVGSRFSNELVGGPGRDRLVGLGGFDGLLGEAGADVLVGGGASDLLDGGGGPDVLRSRDRGRDQLRCGSAFDRAFADRVDRIDADCDRRRLR